MLKTDNHAVTKSTVGLMVKHTTIDNMMFGGPAFLSKQFQKGDEVIAIDSEKATTDNIIALLIGSDEPGSKVTITCRRNFVQTWDTTLVRARTTELVDLRAIFALFTKLKDMTNKRKDDAMGEVIDEILDLWSKMTEAAQERDEEVSRKVNARQAESKQAVKMLAGSLARLHSAALTAVSRTGMLMCLSGSRDDMPCRPSDRSPLPSDEVVKKEAEIYQELKSIKQQHEVCLDRVESLRTRLAESESTVTGLRRQIQNTKDALDHDDATHAETKARLMKADKDRNDKRVKLGASAMTLPSPSDTDEQMYIGTCLGIAELRQKVKELNKAHSPCQGTIRKLETTMQERADSIAQLKDVVKKLEHGIVLRDQDIAAVHQEHASCGPAITGRDNEIQRLKQAMAEAQAMLSKTIASREDDIAALKAQLAEEKRRADSLHKEHMPCGPTMAQQRADIERLQQEVAARDKRVLDLNAVIQAHQDKVSELQQQHAPCSSTIKAREDEIRRLIAVVEGHDQTVLGKVCSIGSMHSRCKSPRGA